MRKVQAFLLLLATSIGYSQYFPLQAGNQWIYRVEEGPAKDIRVAEVQRSEVVAGAEYFNYRGLMGEVARIRVTSDNTVVELQGNGNEALWWDFAATEGATFPTAFDPCTGRGRIVSRSERAEELGRQWDNGIRIAYSPTSCADAGVLEDLFFPGLGLAERTYQTIAGPRRYRITYAKIGNATVVAEGEYSFRIHLSDNKYPPHAPIELRLALENRTKEPLILRFPSSQSYDFQIRDGAGREIYHWSADKLFPLEYREVSVRGEKNWAVTQELDLRPGQYVIEAWLTTAEKPYFRAQLPFTVEAEAAK